MFFVLVVLVCPSLSLTIISASPQAKETSIDLNSSKIQLSEEEIEEENGERIELQQLDAYALWSSLSQLSQLPTLSP